MPLLSNPWRGGLRVKNGLSPGTSLNSFLKEKYSLEKVVKSSPVFSWRYSLVSGCFPASFPRFYRRSVTVSSLISRHVHASLRRWSMPT